MKIIRDYEKNMDVEALLFHVKSANPSLYEDDAEDLLEQVGEKDVLHPIAVYREAKITDRTEDAVYIDDVPFKSTLLLQEAKVGDTVYPCLITVGTVMDAFSRELDDMMLQFLNGMLMTACLDDGLAEIAAEIVGDEKAGRMFMVKPGIAGACELSEQEQILHMLPGALEETGVKLGEDGMLRPAYSSTAVLFLGNGEDNICADWEDLGERAAFVERLNVIAGHV